MAAEHKRPWTGLRGSTRRAGRLDRVEVKILVPESDHGVLASALRMREAPTRRVYFLDTPDLDLARQGLVVRVRTHSSGGGDSVVKLRRTRPGPLPRGMRWSRNVSVELDALPQRSWWTTAVACPLRPAVVRAAVRGREPLQTLISAEQRRFLRAVTTTAHPLRELRVHGPIAVTRMIGEIPGDVGRGGAGQGGARKLVLESWAYPDGSRLYEVSTKCRPARAPRVAEAIRHLLAERGIHPTSEQQTKTGASLAHFAR
ncbi:MAG: CYTH domain-containing protein [Pseudonocardia sp.]|nr:CYTH domain-containing protein [Pseudonocardia sp.]